MRDLPRPRGRRTDWKSGRAHRCAGIREGDSAELLVQSSTPYFETFEVVRDVFFPQLGAWLADYPYLKREAFQRLSASVYSETQRAEPAREEYWQ